MQYYTLYYQLNGEKRYLIWVSNEKDSVVVDSAGFIPSFRDIGLLRQYANLHRYGLEDGEPLLNDLDWVATWRGSPPLEVDCTKALNAWNLFADIATSMPVEGLAFDELESRFPAIYDKLFWGNNLPAVTPEGQRYIPDWSADEVDSLAGVLSTGLQLFESQVRDWDPSSANQNPGGVFVWHVPFPLEQPPRPRKLPSQL